MAVYRYQATCVGLWRGKIKRWNTTFHTTTTFGMRDAIHDAIQVVSYPNPGDAVGACSGGLASITWYDAAGGAPLGQQVYFDWQLPSTWIPYGGGVWSGVPADTPLDASGESAVVVVGQLPGLSRTGKPMSTRKYLHAIPSRSAAAFDDPDISSTVQAGIAASFPLSIMGNPAGVSPNLVTCEPYYGNHQRVRGRRRTVKTVAAQSFSNGVVVGGAAGAAGAAPFPGE